MARYVFSPGQWEKESLVHAYSWRFPEVPVFRQEKDCIVNQEAPGTPQLYDYMGLVTRNAYAPGVQLSARCSFEGDGAPMLLISFGNEVDENGVFRTLEYYEVVIWQHGLNVWRLNTQARRVGFYKAMGAVFPLEEGRIYNVSAEIQPQRLLIQLDEHRFELYVPDLPEEFHLGWSACEGICRLYEMSIEPKAAEATLDGAVAML